MKAKPAIPWKEAYRSCYPYWVNIARHMGLSRDEAEDVVEDIVLKMLESETFQFQSLENMRSYVAVGVVNTVKNRFAREPDMISLTNDIDTILSAASVSEDTEDTLRAEKRTSLLQKAIETLRPEEQSVLALHFIYGRTYREISEETGIPPTTLESRVVAARKKVAAFLREHL